MIDGPTTTSRDDDDRACLDELRAEIEIGWQQSERGEGRDGEAVFSELRNWLVRILSNQWTD